MNEIYLINAATVHPSDLVSFEKSPKYRKATKSMLMAALAIQRVLELYPEKLKEFSSDLGLFLGTGHGEMEATRNFLKRLKETGTGGPIYFQNSLHNSTTGFLTQQFGIHGASLTTANTYFSGENALDLASIALQQNQISFALVIGVDALVPELNEALDRMYPEGLSLGEGAGALFICNSHGLKLIHPSGRRSCLKAIEYCHQATEPSHEALADLNGYYDANFIALLAENFLKETKTSPMVFNKPNGTYSKITLSFE